MNFKVPEIVSLGEVIEGPKLDRCFGNKMWHRLFPASNQVFLDKRGSDHRPVLVKLSAVSVARRGQFRFDGRFLHKKGVKEEIKKAWLTNHPYFEATVSERLKCCRKSLSNWKKKECLNSRDKINQIQFALEREQSSLGASTTTITFFKKSLSKLTKKKKNIGNKDVRSNGQLKGT